MPTSGYRTSRNFVVTTTRRVWSAAEKAAIVGEMGEDGANVSEIARRHGVAQSLLYRWRQDLATASLSGHSPVYRAEALRRLAKADATVPQFLPVVIAAPAEAATLLPSQKPPARKRRTPPIAASMTSGIDVVLANGRLVRVGADVDTAALLRIVAALEGAQ